MIQAADFIEPLLGRGYSFWTGVPCSFLTPFINYVIGHPSLRYLVATSEGEAVGLAAGAHLAGKKTVVMCQNSGLGNAVNPLTSLSYPFRIPTLMIVTHRGRPGAADEPQHELMGRITEKILTTVGVRWKTFPGGAGEIGEALDEAEEWTRTERLPFAFIMQRGAVEPHPLKEKAPGRSRESARPEGAFKKTRCQRMPRVDAIRIARDALQGNEAIVATTGHIGRELFDLGHRKNQFYVVGSMGCASAIGLGIHTGGAKRPVVVFDGDGAALMKLGSLATIGHYRPERLLHIIFDNEVHESTGGQDTASSSVDFAGLAVSCGYSRARRVEDPEGLASAVRCAGTASGPTLIHVKVGLGSDPQLARPNLTPVQVKEQFMDWLLA